MPISREAFDRGLSALEDSVVNFLNKNSHNAYTTSELANYVGADTSSLTGAISFTITLRMLVTKGSIRSKSIGDDTYYTSAKAGS